MADPIDEIAQEIDAKLDANLDKAAAHLAQAMAANVPHKWGPGTGQLAAGMGFIKGDNPLVRLVGSKTYYARFVELGTIHAKAYPFMRQTVIQEAEAIYDIVTSD